jgi:ribosomal protein S27AE
MAGDPRAKAATMACPNCGSWAVRADRSLSGRMVCARCGTPLGIGAQRRPARPARPGGQAAGRHRRLWLGLAALVAVSALLAALPRRDSEGPLRERPMPGAGRGGRLSHAAPGMSQSADRRDPGRRGSGIM